MTKEEQKKIINDILDYEKQRVTKLIDDDKIPSNWSGVELRHYLADCIDQYKYLITGMIARKYRQALKDNSLQ